MPRPATALKAVIFTVAAAFTVNYFIAKFSEKPVEFGARKVVATISESNKNRIIMARRAKFAAMKGGNGVEVESIMQDSSKKEDAAARSVGIGHRENKAKPTFAPAGGIMLPLDSTNPNEVMTGQELKIYLSQKAAEKKGDESNGLANPDSAKLGKAAADSALQKQKLIDDFWSIYIASTSLLLGMAITLLGYAVWANKRQIKLNEEIKKLKEKK
ncbi:hypothetical protein FJZ26_00380 [Candidatus Parvarchaeota archaeon]|nr:hypothetical protein [Candidatus Parvarchaeota archaeon]